MTDNQKTKTVRMSDATMEKLAKVRNGWESPNDCINRVLSKNPCKSETKEQTEDNSDSSESAPQTHEVE